MTKFSSNRLFLVGYMGSGKSTVGQQLAEKLEYLHIDTDESIIKLSGLSIPEFFEIKGESAFREEETKVTQLISRLNNVVISTGGGLPIYNNNMRQITEAGLTIYLEASINTLMSRITHDGHTRPIHKDLSRDQLLQSINEKLQSRNNFYHDAHLTINANGSVGEIIDSILAKL